MSDEQETPPEAAQKIVALQSIDANGFICWKARGLAAPDPTALAKLLGVAESELEWAIDPEAYEADQKRVRRQRPIVVKSGFPW
jgi:hypothetical protein